MALSRRILVFRRDAGTAGGRGLDLGQSQRLPDDYVFLPGLIGRHESTVH